VKVQERLAASKHCLGRANGLQSGDSTELKGGENKPAQGCGLGGVSSELARIRGRPRRRSTQLIGERKRLSAPSRPSLELRKEDQILRIDEHGKTCSVDVAEDRVKLNQLVTQKSRTRTNKLSCNRRKVRFGKAGEEDCSILERHRSSPNAYEWAR
jgi:hypothetical protein